MRVLPKPVPWFKRVLVDHTQTPKPGKLGVVVIRKVESVVRVQPSMVRMPALLAPARYDCWHNDGPGGRAQEAGGRGVHDGSGKRAAKESRNMRVHSHEVSLLS